MKGFLGDQAWLIVSANAAASMLDLLAAIVAFLGCIGCNLIQLGIEGMQGVLRMSCMPHVNKRNVVLS